MKIFVSDLDQTLLDLEHELPEETKELVKKVREHGHYFGIATGRPMESAEFTIPNISEIFDFAVYENGGIIHDFHSGDIHVDHLLDKETIVEIIEIGRRNGSNPTVTHDGYFYTDDASRYATYGPGFLERLRIVDVLEILESHHPKVIFRGEEDELLELENLLNNSSEGRYRAFKSANDILEVMHPHINKFAGITWFLDKHNLSPESLITFGDNNNDIEMLEGAHLGIAVSNATDQAKNAADKIIGSHVDNAVFHFVKEYLELD